MGVMVVPGFVSVPAAMNAFDEDGTVTEDVAASITALIERLKEAVA